MKKKNAVFILPSLLGLLIFYILPFIFSFYYSVIDNNMSKKFVGLKNFLDTFSNPSFLLASKNTLKFILISVPLSMVISYLMAAVIVGLKKSKKTISLFSMLPLIIPSGIINIFWKNIFSHNGYINKVLYILGFEGVNFQGDRYIFLTILIIFLWKNLGYNIIIFISGLNWIPTEYYEFTHLEGANVIDRFRYVTIPLMLPTAFVVFLFSVVNSFSVYKDIYILYGDYPNNNVYILQHYMNNQFNALNMQKLTSAAYILVAIIAVLMFLVFTFQNNLTKKYN